MLDTETEFRAIDWVDGSGTTTNVVNYSLNDLNPHQGISYYRLKQVNTDRTFSYSKVVQLNHKGILKKASPVYANFFSKNHIDI